MKKAKRNRYTISGFLLIAIFKLMTPVHAFENYPVGARSLALSHASVSFSDVWAAFHNQAGLSDFKSISTGFFYESRFGIDELSLTAGSVVLPVKPGSFALSFFQFGKGTFKENKFGLAFSRGFSEKWSAGIQLDYFLQTFPENERSYGFATFEGGLLFHPSESFTLGAHVFNPVSGGIETPAGKNEMPVVFRIGGNYWFDKMLMVAFETEKDNQNPFLVKTGVEFWPVENFAMRLGVSGKPFKYTAGIGYRIGSFSADAGFGYHGNLGITPSVSIQFNW